MMNLTLTRAACAVFAMALFPVTLPAQPAATTTLPDYPQRPVRLVVAVAAGGSTDIIARIIAAKLGERIGQQVVVDNRPGGSSIIGTEIVARAQPDGYTLIMGSGSMGTITSLFKKLPFDLTRDLAPVSLVATSPYVVVAQPSIPVKTVADLISYGKANPGKLNFSGSTPGSLQRLTGELLKRTGGFDMLFVPYKGTGALMPDLLGGRLHVAIDNVLILAPYIRNNSLRALGVTSQKRSALFPELPSLAETGLPGFHAVGWFGVFATGRTPDAIINRLNGELSSIMRTAEMRERFVGQGSEPMSGPPADLRNYLASEISKWGQVIREAGIKAE